MLATSEVCINKIRVSGHHRDPLSVRLRLDRVLSATDFRPPGLPSTAIVCINRLRDPRPGVLDLSGSMRTVFTWEQALKERLSELIARAPRTLPERNATNPECVIFIDQTDLLASLANDWCRGEVSARWWWRALFRSPPVGNDIRMIWRKAAEHIPAALERLGSQKIEFVTKLRDYEADDLLTAVVRRFAIPSLTPLITEIPLVTTHREEIRANKIKAHQSLVHLIAPWQKVIAESRAPQLSVSQQRFLGLSLMLLRAPSIVRTNRFAREVEYWQQAILAGTSDAIETKVVRPESSQGQVAKTSKDYKPAAQTNRPTATVSVENKSTVVSSERNSWEADESNVLERKTETPQAMVKQQTSLSDHVTKESVDNQTNHFESTIVSERSSTTNQITDLGESLNSSGWESTALQVQRATLVNDALVKFPETVDTNSVASDHAIEAPDVADFTADAQTIELIEECETQFGGVFYLINLGLYLGLYGDFTAPAEPGIELNIWDFVALVGRELGNEEIESDPVWPLLARLAGREVDLDIPTKSELWLPQLTARQSDQICVTDTVPQDLKTWLGHLMPLIHQRLRLAFGLDENIDPGPPLLTHTGVVRITPTHVNVTFSLASLPIMIRLAGLDRDPGWVPAAGRFVAFHFV